VIVKIATVIVGVLKVKSATAIVNAKTEKAVTAKTVIAIANANQDAAVKTIAHTKTDPQKNRDAVAVDTKSNINIQG